MKFRHFIIPVFVVALGGAGYFVYTIHHYVNTTVPNAYAAEWVGGMVVDYLRQHEDHWPQSWEELRPIYDQHVAKVGQPWTFDQLKSRVDVRWDTDVKQVRGLPAPPDDLIRLRDGGKEHWGGHEPNEMVYRYLTQPKPANQPLQ